MHKVILRASRLGSVLLSDAKTRTPVQYMYHTCTVHDQCSSIVATLTLLFKSTIVTATDTPVLSFLSPAACNYYNQI